jgi:hypothetical protein
MRRYPRVLILSVLLGLTACTGPPVQDGETPLSSPAPATSPGPEQQLREQAVDLVNAPGPGERLLGPAGAWEIDGAIPARIEVDVRQAGTLVVRAACLGRGTVTVELVGEDGAEVGSGQLTCQDAPVSSTDALTVEAVPGTLHAGVQGPDGLVVGMAVVSAAT